MRKWILRIGLALFAMFGFLFITGFQNRKTDLYKNMVNSSVMISNESNWGSGVFIYDNVILTAAHVLEQSNLSVELRDGTILEIDDFYIDGEEDIGFIFIDANELCISKLSVIVGDIGDIVYLVGAPYDRRMKFSITKGILSHLDRDVFHWKDLLQTDADSGPGSSGGPLYDSEGNVIGICVASPSVGGSITLCESVKSILEAYERCMNARCQ